MQKLKKSEIHERDNTTMFGQAVSRQPQNKKGDTKTLVSPFF